MPRTRIHPDAKPVERSPNRRIHVLKEPYFLSPSPRIAQALRELEAALYGRGTDGR